MCGIVGYAGNKVVSSVLLVGLRKLEYRGYDSSGLAMIEKNELVIKKASGRIDELESLMQNQVVYGTVGIGHTRWATHGEPNILNAHPHINKFANIAVVHNGIIENFLELKKELSAEGSVFVSETDTEVIPHLIDKFLREGHKPEIAFYKTLKRLEGKFAISMICEEESNRFYFARNGSPLIVALGKDEEDHAEAFISSDLPAIVPLAKKYSYVRDKQWGYFSNPSFKFFGWEAEPIKLKFSKIEIFSEQFEKGKYPHYMLKEIHEQPEILNIILNKRINSKGEICFQEMNLSNEYLARVSRVIIQACGTSLNAGLVGKNYLENYSRIYTDADYSSEFRYRNPVLEGDTLVMGISQSGETADTVAGLHGAKAKFLKVLSFLNNEHSTMAFESDAVVSLFAGPEIGVASTKAYLAELVNLFLFSLYVGSLKWTITRAEMKKKVDEIKALPDKVAEILENVEKIQEIAQHLKDVSDAIFLGRSFNYPTALEGALKLKEISYIHSSGYAAGEFKHGPIALVSQEVPVIVVVPHGSIRPKMISNLLEVKARKGKIISVITKGDKEVMDLSDFTIEIPAVPEYLSPMVTVIPLQLIAYYTAIYRNCDVDKPRNLAKSVTVE